MTRLSLAAAAVLSLSLASRAVAAPDLAAAPVARPESRRTVVAAAPLPALAPASVGLLAPVVSAEGAAIAVDGAAASLPASAAEARAAAPAGRSAGAAALGARIDDQAAAVDVVVERAGDIRAAGAESASSVGRQAQDLLEGQRTSFSAGAVRAARPSAALPSLAAPARGDASARRWRAPAAAAALLLSAAAPASAAAAASPIIPGAAFGMTVGILAALAIAAARLDTIVSWVPKAAGYIFGFAATGAAIGAVATLDVGAIAAPLAAVGAAYGALISLVATIARWRAKNRDAAFEALKKSLALMWSFGAMGTALGALLALQGHAMGAPVAVGLVVAAVVASVIGVIAPQDEFAWLQKAARAAGLFAGAGLLVGLATVNADPILGSLAAAGFAVGALFAGANAVALWKRGKPAPAYEWFKTAGIYMGVFGVLGAIVAALWIMVTPWAAVPGGIGVLLGSAASTWIAPQKLLGASEHERLEDWLKHTVLLASFAGGVGALMGGLLYFGGLTSVFFTISGLFGGLPAVPGVGALALLAAPLAFLVSPYFLAPAAGGLAVGLALSLLLGREQFLRQRRQWLTKARKLTSVLTGIGGLVGVGLLVLTSVLTQSLGLGLAAAGVASILLVASAVW